jgi:hypothetical protein
MMQRSQFRSLLHLPSTSICAAVAAECRRSRAPDGGTLTAAEGREEAQGDFDELAAGVGGVEGK